MFGDNPEGATLDWNSVGACFHYFGNDRTIQFRLWVLNHIFNDIHWNSKETKFSDIQYFTKCEHSHKFLKNPLFCYFWLPFGYLNQNFITFVNLNDGQESLFLDYYFGYTKVYNDKTGKETIKKDLKREYLSLYLWQAPITQLERQQNKEMLEMAKKIRFEREQELKEDKLGYRLKKEEVEINYLDWMAGYHANYTKSDGNQISRARTVFIDFLIDPKMKLLPEKVKSDMTKEEKEAI